MMKHENLMVKHDNVGCGCEVANKVFNLPKNRNGIYHAKLSKLVWVLQGAIKTGQPLHRRWGR